MINMMKTISISTKGLCWIMLLSFYFASEAQSQSSFRLMDASSQEPIIGATFEYHQQKGQSNMEGLILFDFEEDASMRLSHLSYGQWLLHSGDLKKAIKEGMVFRSTSEIRIYPVSVIALRPKRDETEVYQLEDLDRLAHDGGEVLNHTPLINGIRKSGSYGFDPVLRGFKYDQINIVMDGIQSASAACPNRMDPPSSQMAPNMIKQIEIIKGPHALRYGNAIGGTINFIPSDHRYSVAGQTYGRLASSFESNGSVFRNEGLLGFRSESYDLGLFASWSQGNDYLDGANTTIPADFSRGSFGARLGVKLSSNQQISIQATNNIAKDADFAALPMDLRHDNTLMVSVRHQIIFDRRHLTSWKNSIYGTFVDHMMDNKLKKLVPRMMNAETNATTRSYGGRTEGSWSTPNGPLLAGMDLRIEEASGIRTRSFLLGPNAGKVLYDNAWQNSKISKTGVFATYHGHQSDLEVMASGRIELNQARALDLSTEYISLYEESEETQINPGVSIGMIKHMESQIALGLWVGRTQRSASITERYINYFPVGQDPYEMVGNPLLRPEANNQVDVTLEYKTQNSVLNLDVFTSYLQHYISSEIRPELSPRLPNSPGVRQFINLKEALSTGFEFSWRQTIATHISQSAQMAYTYARRLDNRDPLPEIAPLDFRYEVSGHFLNDKFLPSAQIRHVVKQDRISTDFGETSTPGFTLLDILMTYRIAKSWQVNVGIYNLFDKTYYEHLNRSVRSATARPIYAPGRSFLISLAMDMR